MLKTILAGTLVGTLMLGSLVIAEPSPTASKPAALTPAAPTTAPSQAELETKFAQSMSNATLSGSFSMNGSDKIGKDQYKLGEVTKKDGDNWQIIANIKYGQHDVSLPLMIPVKWAGDTPVISVTDFGFPGLGKYTARVMFYGDQYVGIWSSSDGSHGGQMWGKLEQPKK